MNKNLELYIGDDASPIFKKNLALFSFFASSLSGAASSIILKHMSDYKVIHPFTDVRSWAVIGGLIAMIWFFYKGLQLIKDKRIYLTREQLHNLVLVGQNNSQVNKAIMRSKILTVQEYHEWEIDKQVAIIRNNDFKNVLEQKHSPTNHVLHPKIKYVFASEKNIKSKTRKYTLICVFSIIAVMGAYYSALFTDLINYRLGIFLIFTIGVIAFITAMKYGFRIDVMTTKYKQPLSYDDYIAVIEIMHHSSVLREYVEQVLAEDRYMNLYDAEMVNLEALKSFHQFLVDINITFY